MANAWVNSKPPYSFDLIWVYLNRNRSISSRLFLDCRIPVTLNRSSKILGFGEIFGPAVRQRYIVWENKLLIVKVYNYAKTIVSVVRLFTGFIISPGDNIIICNIVTVKAGYGSTYVVPNSPPFIISSGASAESL